METKTVKINMQICHPTPHGDYKESEDEFEFKLPKGIMQLLQDKHFFTKTLSDFFENAVRAHFSGYMQNMDDDKMHRLLAKYGLTDDDLTFMIEED